MRAEDIVGLSFFAVLFCGIGLLLYGNTKPKGSVERGRWLAAGLAVEGLALTAFGLGTMVLIHVSAQPEVVGYIWGVSGSSVKNPHTDFSITTDSGAVVRVRARYDGPGLRSGDRARVRYVAYTGSLLELTMLSGSYTGWRLEESSGETGPAIMATIGVVCGLAGWRRWRQV